MGCSSQSKALRTPNAAEAQHSPGTISFPIDVPGYPAAATQPALHLGPAVPLQRLISYFVGSRRRPSKARETGGDPCRHGRSRTGRDQNRRGAACTTSATKATAEGLSLIILRSGHHCRVLRARGNTSNVANKAGSPAFDLERPPKRTRLNYLSSAAPSR